MVSGKRNPFDELERLFERMNQQFERAAGDMDTGGMFGMGSASVDVADRDNELVVTADLPGFDKEDIDVKLSGDTLQIEAQHEEATEEGDEAEYIRRERSHQTVSRSVTLPEQVREDDVTARYKNGVLTVTLPKVHDSSTSRSIDID